MYEIINQTKATVESETRKLDKNGKIIFTKGESGLFQIHENDVIKYGPNTIGLCNGEDITEQDWKHLRDGFEYVHKDGTITVHHCIGGSDAGVLTGNSKWQTPRGLFQQKLGLVKEELTDSKKYIFAYGHTNEELVAKGFAMKTGLDVYKISTVFFNLRTGCMQANVDFFTKSTYIDENGVKKKGLFILEIKTTNPSGKESWGTKDTPIVPKTYRDQALLHYPRVLEDLNVKGTYWCCAYDNSLENLIVRKELLTDEVKIEADQLEEAEKAFVSNYLEKNIMPTFTLPRDQGNEKSNKDESNKEVVPFESLDFNQTLDLEVNSINKMFDDVNSDLPKILNLESGIQTITLDEQCVDSVIQEYISMNEYKKNLESQAKKYSKCMDMLKSMVLTAVENNNKVSTVIGNKNFVIYSGYYANRESIPKENLEKLKENYPEIAEKYIRVTQGSRKFSIKEEKPKKKKGEENG